MNAHTTARTEANVDFALETGHYTVKAIGVLSALIGAWGILRGGTTQLAQSHCAEVRAVGLRHPPIPGE